MYPIMNIIAPLILLATLIYFTVRQWKRSPRDEAISDRGARELREQLNEEDQERPTGSR